MAKETWLQKMRKKSQKKYGIDSDSGAHLSPEEKKKMAEAYEEAVRKKMMEDMERQAVQDLKLKKLEKKLQGKDL